MRIDLALHALRWFRSRSAAQAAIEEGAVLLNGQRVKSSHSVQAGDRVTLFAASGATRTLEILSLPRKGLSKVAAAECFREVEPRA